MKFCHSLFQIVPLALLLTRIPCTKAAQYGFNEFDSSQSQLTLAADVEKHHETDQNGIATEAVLLDPLESLSEALDVLQSTWFEPWVVSRMVHDIARSFFACSLHNLCDTAQADL